MAAVVAPPSLGLEHAVVVGVEAIVRLARPPVGVAQPLLALGPGEQACSPIYIELQTKAQVRALITVKFCDIKCAEIQTWPGYFLAVQLGNHPAEFESPHILCH